MDTLWIAFSMFSRIPVPQVEWNERNTKNAVLFLPFVGAVIGGAEMLLLKAANAGGFPTTVTVLLFVAVPLILTGGIHLDGLIDTADARHSFGSVQEKLQILKDPHVGAFGIIRLLLYMLLLLAALELVFEKEGGNPFAVMVPFMLSRALSALAAVSFPKAKKEGLLYTLSEEGRKGARLAALLEVLFVAGLTFLLFPLPTALGLLFGEMALLVFYRRFALRNFGGITGDLSGWFLCLSELLFAWIVAMIP